MTTCPGCHGTGTETTGVAYGGLSEDVDCGQCGEHCPEDCGCRVDVDDVCSGDADCASVLHVHGCFADHGQCAEPGSHTKDAPASPAAQGWVEDIPAVASDMGEFAEWSLTAAQGPEPVESGVGGGPGATDSPSGSLSATLVLTEAEAACVAGWRRLAGASSVDALLALVDRLVGEVARLGSLRIVDAIREMTITEERDRARATAALAEAEEARLRERVAALASWLDGLRHSPDPDARDLMPAVAQRLTRLLADGGE